AHGADPNVVCAKERETSLHVAIRRSRSMDTVRRLLEHGANVNVPRGDGRTPWRLAYQAGNGKVLALLESAGARPEATTSADELLAACARGDVAAATRLGSAELVASRADEDLQVLVDAARIGRSDVVHACLAGGFPVNHEGEFGGTALHHACISGRPEVVRVILRYGPDLTLRDRTHDSTALGWATYGAEFVREPGGDYVACVRQLLAAGARPLPTDRVPQDPELAALIRAAQ